jgi:hypothetical protein
MTATASSVQGVTPSSALPHGSELPPLVLDILDAAVLGAQAQSTCQLPGRAPCGSLAFP